MTVKFCKWVQDFSVKSMEKLSLGTDERCIFEKRYKTLCGEETLFLIANAHELKFLMDQETKWFMGLNRLISMACLGWLIYIHSKSMACIKSEITNYMAHIVHRKS